MTEAIKKAMALLPAFKHELITAKNSGRIWAGRMERMWWCQWSRHQNNTKPDMPRWSGTKR
jgi:hypothetical protein